MPISGSIYSPRWEIRWLGKPYAWGFWPCGPGFRWIFDIGPLRVLRYSR